MEIRNLLISFFLLFPFMLSAQDPLLPDSVFRKKKNFVEDDPVVAMLDSLSTLKIFRDNTYSSPASSASTPVYSSTGTIPNFSDSVYRDRIKKMSQQSPFEYIFNDDVRKFIDLYAIRKRGLTARILGLSQIYFPLFEEQLDKFNMPLELKYLAVIESALNPVANSPAGAKGLWQFMYSTGKGYGLKISSYVDDRFDPYKSTIAACEHLTDLYDIYGNWSLALAAYNSGAGNVNKAIRRAGGVKNFWLIQHYLPKETRSYVPAFIAASYVLTYAREHNITPIDPGILFYEIDTVTVRKPLTFDQLSEMLNIPMEEIVFLNPSFKQGVIPATADNPYKLRLRKKFIGDFINNEDALYAYKTRKGLEQDSLMALIALSTRETTQYVVKSGETMASIARKFHMTTGDLKYLNNIKKNSVKPRQKLFVYLPPKGKVYSSSPVAAVSNETTNETTHKSGNETAQTNALSEETHEKATNHSKSSSKSSKYSSKTSSQDQISSSSSSATRFHVVQTGENLNKISQKYGCSINDIIQWNKLKNSNIMVGQKLKVAAPEIHTSSAETEASGKPTASLSHKTTAKDKKEKDIEKEKDKKDKKDKKTKPVVQKYIWYTIKPGDNLWEIAAKYDGVTVAQIKKLNDISNINHLKSGQKIKIMAAE
ncbi:MAG: LysM peptidoglycan-binding domain-containing protein [Bacteroidota bacterium]|nr:LysM peptidoglycan-binding domain-containing protein [Bacteroidota bacterium]